MKSIFPICLAALLVSCADPVKQEEKRAAARQAEEIRKVDTDTLAAKATLPPLPLPAPPQPVKKPEGVYHTILQEGTAHIEHIILFNKNGTYRLQEKWNRGDSVVSTQGTWNPSNGYIWLYKGQLAHGRYAWKGSTLQYVHPGQKKSYDMMTMPLITASKFWIDKGRAGTRFYGIGNEPFWSIELGAGDTLAFHYFEWKEALRMKATPVQQGDSLIIEARNDSTTLKVVVLPQFCSDGMSDYMYRNSVRVQFNDKSYSGCGQVYR